MPNLYSLHKKNYKKIIQNVTTKYIKTIAAIFHSPKFRNQQEIAPFLSSLNKIKQEINILEKGLQQQISNPHEISNQKDRIDFYQKTVDFLEWNKRVDMAETRRFVLNKNFSLSQNENIILLAIYVHGRELTAFQKQLVSFYKNAGFKVVLIIACSDFDYFNRNQTYDSDIEIIRENVGYDFGSWSTAINIIPNLKDMNSITFTNDSVCPLNFDLDLFEKMNHRIMSSEKDVVYLTENNELHNHHQSYYFCLNKLALEKDALEVLGFNPSSASKYDLILNVEIGLSSLLSKKELSIETLYSYSNFKGNLTINNWQMLLNDDFPFIKLMLFQINENSLDSSKFRKILSDDLRKKIKDHINSRGKFEEQFLYENFDEIKKEKDLNYPPYFINRPIKLDIKNYEDHEIIDKKFICIQHAYYVDIAIKQINKLISLEIPFILIITTDLETKKKELIKFCNRNSIDANINIHENRGRDIKPFFSELKKLKKTNLPILHLHTKKSPHEEGLSNWGDNIFSKLISTKQNVIGILEIFEKTNIGIIYPDFIDIIKRRINWGYNFKKAHSLLKDLNIDIDVNDFLLFPAGSMFWLKYDAIEELINYKFKDNFFEEEDGQEDGTGAHALERVFFHICKEKGFEYLPITIEEKNKKIKSMTIPTFYKINHLVEYCKRYTSPEFKRYVKAFLPENNLHLTYPVLFKKNINDQSRINLIIPTLEPEKVYGGITTALKLFKKIIEFGSYEQVRIIVTTDGVSLEAIKYVNSFFKYNFSVSKGNIEDGYLLHSIIPLKTNSERILDISEKDIYVSSAWWTADLGLRIVNKQNDFFKRDGKLIYLIQDFEPGFYPQGTIYAKAKATYEESKKVIAIINSEELYNFFSNNFDFFESYYVPFELNDKLLKELNKYINSSNQIARKKIIICYGRPSTPRNCFETIVSGLKKWQDITSSEVVKSWKIYFIGEKFDKNLIRNLKNARVLNKLSLENYALIMQKAKIGISLMESPHPSYPPIEMASFGVKVLTNKYLQKDLSLRNKNIISLEKNTPDSLSVNLRKLTQTDELNNDSEINIINAPYCEGKIFDSENLNSIL